MTNIRDFLNIPASKHAKVPETIRNEYLIRTYDSMEEAAEAGNYRREAEKQLTQYISLGNTAKADELIEELRAKKFSLPVGELSEDPLRQARYSITAAVTLFSREAIDAGLPEHLSFSISDSYIRYADRSQSVEEVQSLFLTAFREYCAAVETWRLRNTRPELKVCCEYISSHMHRKITMEDLSNICHLSANYISDLFQKELGIRPKQYILKEKINYAAYILRTTDAPISEIAALLAFSSPSAFSAHFTQIMGVLPNQYRHQAAE